MNPPDYERVRRAFFDVCNLSEDQRGPELRELLADRPDLVGEVESLLAAEARASGSVLLDPERIAAADEEPPALERYEILRKLAEGGMGTVYEARQLGTQRVVALKFVRPELTTPELLRRLEYEARVLGLLQHPGIAQIHEAGAIETPAGRRPFFAMELVRGEPITSYVERLGLPASDRLQLVARICDAVHHAHQKGVVHRDLKPTNILVDRNGQPKILDFGIARATTADSRKATRLTRHGEMLGTIPYMSPEQASGESEEIDVRTDVYSLGVVAYELLAGRTPHDLEDVGFHRAVRILVEDEPPLLGALERDLRGDVETVIATAMAKEKERRYPSASGFAADLRRIPAHEPIAARPPSRSYHIRKFAKRHRSLVTSVGAFLALLLVAFASTTWGLLEVRAQERVASERLQQTLAARAEADATQELFLELVSAADPWSGLGPDATMGEAFDVAVRAIESEFDPAHPELEAAARNRIGTTYVGLGAFESAERHLERALELRRELLGDHHPDTIETQRHHAKSLQHLGQLDRAVESLREVVALLTEVHGEEHAERLASMDSLGRALIHAGRLEEAETWIRAALEAQTARFGPDDEHALTSTNDLGWVLSLRGELEEAERWSRAAAEGRGRVLGETHPDTLASKNNLASVLHDLGRLEDVGALYEEVVAAQTESLGAEHYHTLTAKSNLAWLHMDLERYEQCEELVLEILAARRSLLGEEHPDTILSLNQLATVRRKMGRHDTALSTAREVLALRDRVLGPDHPHSINSLNLVALCLMDVGELGASEEAFRDGIGRARDNGSVSEVSRATMCGNYARCLAALGRLEEARAEMDSAVQRLQRELGVEHPLTRRFEERQRELHDRDPQRATDAAPGPPG